VEYFPPQVVGQVSWFVGLIEDAETLATATRVAFPLDDEEALAEVERIVREAGGSVVESSIVETYPAIFFEDPCGTRLEICARRPRPIGAS
ncbi:MAG: hypothetical protein IAI50_20245, partial [Candidatus Eremiobacteraeota bacterium]|nr:hypothetical protein [Candidatus Eremiobacteraeota bacterium]